MKVIEKIRRAPQVARTYLTGNGSVEIDVLEDRLDQVLTDAERFDQAVWDVVKDGRDRLYRVVEVVIADDSKKGKSKIKELRDAAASLAASSRQLVADFRSADDESSNGSARKRTTRKKTTKSRSGNGSS
jgi:hypothetical protein